MKKLLLTLLLILPILSVAAFCQHSDRQAGIRAGYRGGLFYQANTNSGNAGIGYMAMLQFGNCGIQVTGLRIISGTSLPEISPDLYFNWGYGAHAGFIVTDNISYFGERYTFKDERFCPLVGVDGWAAVEYRFRDFPVNVSLNIKPAVELMVPAFVRLRLFDIGLSVAYVF